MTIQLQTETFWAATISKSCQQNPNTIICIHIKGSRAGIGLNAITEQHLHSKKNNLILYCKVFINKSLAKIRLLLQFGQKVTKLVKAAQRKHQSGKYLFELKNIWYSTEHEDIYYCLFYFIFIKVPMLENYIFVLSHESMSSSNVFLQQKLNKKIK